MSEAQKKTRVIRVSARLIDEMVTLVVDYPDTRKTLVDFFRFRREAGPVAPFGAKDSPLKGKNLGGIWHTHLVFGKALLIYKMLNTEVHCYCIVDHTFVDSKTKQKRLATIIKELEKAGLIPFDAVTHLPVQVDVPVELDTTPVAVAPSPLAPDEVNVIRNQLYEFAAHAEDSLVVQKAQIGDFEDLKIYLGCVLDRDFGSTLEWELVTAEFGGQSAFQAKLGAILMELAPQDS